MTVTYSWKNADMDAQSLKESRMTNSLGFTTHFIFMDYLQSIETCHYRRHWVIFKSSQDAETFSSPMSPAPFTFHYADAAQHIET